MPRIDKAAGIGSVHVAFKSRGEMQGWHHIAGGDAGDLLVVDARLSKDGFNAWLFGREIGGGHCDGGGSSVLGLVGLTLETLCVCV